MYGGVILLSLCGKLTLSAFVAVAFVARLMLSVFVEEAFVARLMPFVESSTLFGLCGWSLCDSFPLEWTLFIRIICEAMMPPRRAPTSQQNPQPIPDMASAIQAIHAMATAMAQQFATSVQQATTSA
ncbi:hypothetical protein KIW84_070840 [Lathyrus oleraceus]|uniref:Uncharacterized protein n=1 Tax=Pisum sativum TaxID=3888 RepID=A0A9D4ZV48_PEA|nr:hypothetical protein KIW84_070840 [Pisum sativum]